MMKTMLTFTVFAPSIPAKLSKMTSLAKLDDELDTSMKTVSKETEGGKHLTKRCNKTLPGELDDKLDKALKNVPKEAKKILLKVAICDKTPEKHSDKYLLRELIDELHKVVKIFSKENKEKEIFLTKKLLMDGCKRIQALALRVILISLQREAFCQAEQELIKKVSGLSGAKFGHFCIDKKLMRNLNMHNKRHVQRHVGPHSGSSGEDME